MAAPAIEDRHGKERIFLDRQFRSVALRDKLSIAVSTTIFGICTIVCTPESCWPEWQTEW